MKRLITFTLVLLLVFSVTACGDREDIQGGSMTTPSSSPAIASPKGLLQGDAGSPAVDSGERTPKQPSGANSPQENNISADRIESISADITAANIYVLNADTDTVLYQKNSKERIAPASTAKILTALTVLDYCALDDIFTVGTEIGLIAPDSSRAWINEGDKLSVRQLLIALLLPSGNDAAYTLAVNTGKKIAAKSDLETKQAVKVFVDAMNQKAKDVGAVSSNFANPDGYDADGQYTTAFDLAQIAKASLDKDVLSEIMGSYKINETLANGREVTYTNTNELINPNSKYYYAGAIGLKTGSTGNAGSCLVSAAYIDEQTYICVVMGSSAGIRFSDSLAVFSSIDPTISLLKTIGDTPPLAPGGLGK